MNGIVILKHDRWMRLWQKMCNDLGYVPSWDEYPGYFGCIDCDSTMDSGLKIIFETKEEALLFKLECG